MPGVRRPPVVTLVLDLTRRLAEEFHTVPIPTVTRVVRSAVDAVTLLTADLPSSLGTVEQLARQELAALDDAMTPPAELVG